MFKTLHLPLTVLTRRRQWRAKGGQIQRGGSNVAWGGGVRQKGQTMKKISPSDGRRHRCTRIAGTVSRSQDGQEGAGEAIGISAVGRSLRRGLSRITISAALPSLTTSRRSGPTSSRAITRSRTCSSTSAWARSIVFPNRAAAEIDFYAGVRPTFGAARPRLRRLVLLVPGWAVLPQSRAVRRRLRVLSKRARLPINGNVVKSEPELLGGLRQGYRDGERSVRVRWRGVLLATPC